MVESGLAQGVGQGATQQAGGQLHEAGVGVDRSGLEWVQAQGDALRGAQELIGALGQAADHFVGLLAVIPHRILRFFAAQVLKGLLSLLQPFGGAARSCSRLLRRLGGPPHVFHRLLQALKGLLQLLILLAENKFPPPPPQEETKDGKKDKGKKRMSEVKDPKKEPAKADDAANKPAAVPAGGAAPAAAPAPTAAPGAAAVNATKPVAPMPAAQQKPAAPAPSKPAPARPVAVTPAQPAKPAQKEAIKEGPKGATP